MVNHPVFIGLAVLVFGIALGSSNYLSWKLGQVVATVVAPKGFWLYTLVTIMVFAALTALVLMATTMLDMGPVSFQHRRRYMLFLWAGYLCGLYVGRAVVRRFDRTSP